MTLLNSEPRKKYVTGMKSLKELYKIGKGPSSSHTMGPERAAKWFKEKYPNAENYKAVLYGSLAKTGVGHRTDYIIKETLLPKPTEVVFDMENNDIPHPNTMCLFAYKEGELLGQAEIRSVGGGAIRITGEESTVPQDVYKLHTFDDIAAYCEKNNLRLWEYVEEVEGAEIWDYLSEIWYCMRDSIKRGLNDEGVIFGGLDVQKKAKSLYRKHHIDESPETKENRLVCSYAYAVAEQNASCGTIVTAPTCGSCGIVPAVLKYVKDKRGFTDTEVLHALATGGLIGNLIKANASISGAECGCQAEVGGACAMAAAALAELYGMSLNQIEYAAENSIEHYLGLTCDPIKGLVQIPCIERNAVAAMRAINAVNLANFLTDTRKISFDLVVQTMYETGTDLSTLYKETGEGGLAKLYKK